MKICIKPITNNAVPKVVHHLLSLLMLGAGIASLPAAPDQVVSIVDRGAHHRTVRITSMTPLGREQTTKLVELESGMHRWDGRAWVDASPRIEIVNGKAVANLFYSVELGPNLATRDAVKLILPDGNRLIMRVLGLAYVENNKSVMIAEVQDCIGEIGGSEQNEVNYRDAFTDFPIDCKFIVRKGSFSQHIRIRSALPPPTDFGLSENAFLEVFTELIEFPIGVIETRRWRTAQADQPEILDQKISFGAMEFVTGKAFFAEDNALTAEVPVSKVWSVLEERTFLRERIAFRDIKAELQKLPVVAAAKPKKAPKALAAAGFLPPLASARPSIGDLHVAALGKSEPKAYVVDYELNGAFNSFTNQADITYYIKGPTTIKTNIFEGGSIIKFAPTNNAKLTITGPITNYASMYRPVIFTARDDHTVGTVVGLAPGISGYYALKALELDWYTSGALANLEHFRFRYAQVGVHFNGGLGNVLSHAQFVNCSNAIEQTSSDVSLRNALIHKANKAFAGNTGSTNRGEHLTIHEVVDLHNSGNPVLLFTNSILVAITNAGTYSGLSNQTASAVGAGFEVVGAGYHYLTNNSVWRDAGTTTINSDLLAYLRVSTTYPPTLYSNAVITSDTHFVKQVSRDTNAPDIGYHAPPLDYAVHATWVSNCVLSVTNGVAIGTFGGGGGFLLQQNSRFVVRGTATDMVEFTPYYTVQEQPLKWGPGNIPAGMVTLNSWWSNGVPPQVSIRFASFDAGGYHLYSFDDSHSGYTNLAIRDCRFSGGSIDMSGVYQGEYAFTNNVFERTFIMIIDPRTATFANNNFRGAVGFLWQMSGSNGLWQFKDNLVDSSPFIWASDCAREFNAFYDSADFYSILNTNATEKVLTNLVYETGRFGRWYQPAASLLMNAGSTADSASVGFYWYSTTTNHAIEANSHLDIGYHSIGLNSGTGEPWDTNEDGIANYLQDLSGNGITEPNELYGLKLWLKADAGVTAPSDLVSNWDDQSGNANNATQGTGGKYPLFVGGALNSRPVIRFDGTNDFLTLPNFASAFTTGEVFAVLRADSAIPSTNRGLWRFGLQSGRYPDTNGLITECFGTAVGARMVGTPSLSITNYHTYNVLSASTEWSARVNGILHLITNSTSVSFPNEAPILGRSTSIDKEYFKGDIAEVLLYNRALSALNRDELSTYLNQRYALVAAPTTNSGVRATALSSNQVSLSWTNAVESTSVRVAVERRTAASAYATVATLRNASSYLDTGLLAATTYWYRLKAANAAGESAYSVEVSTTTSNTAVQVPLSALALWLKADAGVAGTAVSFWEDQSQNFRHATQSDFSKQPSAAAFAVHGKPVIRFDGSEDFLAFPRYWPTNLSEAEAFVVLKAEIDTPSVQRALWHFSDVDSGYPTTAGIIKDDFGSTLLRESLSSGITLDKYHVYSVSAKANEWINRLNGSILVETNSNTVDFTLDPLLGTTSTTGSQIFHGDIAELHIYSRVLTAAERAAVLFYLNDKYGLVDSDGDGLLDKDEITQGSNPSITDSNSDGLSDWENLQVGLSPTNTDLDGDGISNAAEILNGTSPFAADTDGDMCEDDEDSFPLDPTRCLLPSQPGDTTPPTINLQEPAIATPL